MDKNSRLIAGVIGGVALAFGIASAILAAWAIDRQFAIRGVVQVSAVLVVVTFLAVAVFCCVVGYRLLFNRPNRYGSVLSPIGWKMLALCFSIVGFTMAAIGLGRREYQLFAAAIGLVVLGLGGVLAGRVASAKLSWSPVFPQDTSLLGKKGFAPAGFSCGVEIMNDNRTPMEFVVSVLRNCVGLSETDAIRKMLEIHRKGGALLPTASLDEATRIAQEVTEKARAHNHPLACRAVRIE